MVQVTKLVIEIFMSRMSKETVTLAAEREGLFQKNFLHFDDYNYQLLNKQLFK